MKSPVVRDGEIDASHAVWSLVLMTFGFRNGSKADIFAGTLSKCR